MDYEQKCKEYLERAKEQLNGAKVFDYDNEQIAHDIRTTVYRIFPELKESKDERIRKALIDYFDDANKADENPLQSYGVHTDKAIAWLEKQGQTFTKKDVDDAYLKGVCDTKHELEKQGEQTLAWSEEDEEFISEIISDIKSAQDKHPDSQMNQIIFDEEVTWLKSLKDRVQPQKQWKPSDEQMEALVRCVDYLEDSDNEDLLVMESLLEQLKELC